MTFIPKKCSCISNERVDLTCSSARPQDRESEREKDEREKREREREKMNVKSKKKKKKRETRRDETRDKYLQYGDFYTPTQFLLNFHLFFFPARRKKTGKTRKPKLTSFSFLFSSRKPVLHCVSCTQYVCFVSQKYV